MELIIDNRTCDLGKQLPVLPGYDLADTADVDACREGRSFKVTLPATPNNDAVARFARDPHAAERFNAQWHTARITADGAQLFAGTARLLSASESEYVFELRDGAPRWATQAARSMLQALLIDFRSDLTPTAIRDSWSDETTPVRFFPIHRDEYPNQNDPGDLLPVERMLSVDDYLPFLQIEPLVRAIFGQAGYRIESRFLQSEFFRSLYMSGAYASTDTAAVAARMGFFARRLSAATATASSTGRVYANPSAIYNTVGNFVETATPQSVDADGELLTDLYNNGGSFRIDNGRICFVPTTTVQAGFDYYLRYTTDHRIESRTRLKGFDSIYLGPGAELRFELPNRYVDRRGKLSNNFAYRAIFFNHTEGARYRLGYTLNGTQSLWEEFETRTVRAVTPASGTLTDPVLYVASGSGWVPYTGDWALYDGYVEECGQTTVELRVSTAAERISPASPKFFNQIYFFGAEAGMQLTLHKSCTLQPVFRSGPGYGASISFGDVAHLGIRQSELLHALAHLFNLRFYTDETTRTCYIEPADKLFGAGPEVDWSSRTDFRQPLVRRDIAPEIHERRTWCYRPGDGPVRRLESETGTAFGSWSYDAPSAATLVGEKVLRNPLFAPTVSSTGHLRNAPSALLLQTGDRDDLSQSDETMIPRIVRYAGLHPLPADERWGYPSHANSYPLAAFHFAGDATTAGFTLCFEDRDGIEGLNRFYRRQAAREGSLERITLTLRVAPDEYENLFALGVGQADIRSVFRIETGQGVVRATLATIEAYDPDTHAMRCTFDRLPEDIY